MVSAELTVPTGVTFKWLASGPAGGRNFQRTGRTKSHPELKVVFELADMAQYDIYANNNGDTVCKARVRWNGPLIEAALYHYVQADIYGPLDALAWSDLEGSNRTIEFTIMGQYDSTAATDLVMTVQNDQTSL